MSRDANSDETYCGKLYQELGKAKSEIVTANVRYGALSEELSKTKVGIATSDVGYSTLSENLHKTKPEIPESNDVRYDILSKEICKNNSEVATSDNVRYDILSEELSKNKAHCVSCSHALSDNERRNGFYRDLQDYSRRYDGSVRKITQAVETGSVSLPVEGVIIQSARLTQEQGRPVFFHIKAEYAASTVAGRPALAPVATTVAPDITHDTTAVKVSPGTEQMLQQLALMGFELTPASFQTRLAEAGGDFQVLVAMLLTGETAGDVREAIRKEEALGDTESTSSVAHPPVADTEKEAAIGDIGVPTIPPAMFTKPPVAPTITGGEGVLADTGATTNPLRKHIAPESEHEAAVNNARLTLPETNAPIATTKVIYDNTELMGKFLAPDNEACAVDSSVQPGKVPGERPTESTEGETPPEGVEGGTPAKSKTAPKGDIPTRIVGGETPSKGETRPKSVGGETPSKGETRPKSVGGETSSTPVDRTVTSVARTPAQWQAMTHGGKQEEYNHVLKAVKHGEAIQQRLVDIISGNTQRQIVAKKRRAENRAARDLLRLQKREERRQRKEERRQRRVRQELDRLNGPRPDSNESTEDSETDVVVNGHNESAVDREGDE